MMKLITPTTFSKTLFYLLFLLLSIKASSQQLEYFKKITTNSTTLNLYDMKTDNLGNTFVALMNKGSITIGTQTYACNNTYGNFILLKFDSNGNMLWSKMDGIGDYSLGTWRNQKAINIDSNNNIYILGNLFDSVTFSGTKIIGGKDDYFANYFILKYDNNGNIRWVRSYGSYDAVDAIYDIVFSNDFSIFGIGSYSGGVGLKTKIDTFNLQLPNDQIGSQYIFKMDSNGNILWLKETRAVKIPSLYSGSILNYLTFSDNILYLNGQNIGKTVYDADTIYGFNGCPIPGIFSKFDVLNKKFIITKPEYSYTTGTAKTNEKGILNTNNSILNFNENNGKFTFNNNVSITSPFTGSTPQTIVSKVSKTTNTITFTKGLNYQEKHRFITNSKYISIDVDNPSLPIDNVTLPNKGGLDVYFMEMDSNYNLVKYKTIASNGNDYMDLATSNNNFIYGLVISKGTGTLTAFDSTYTQTSSVNYYITKIKILSAPIAPINLTATHTGSNNVKLQWTDKSNDETKFRIYRSNSASGPFTLIDSVAANITIYNHLNSNTGLQYYQVCAVNSEGQNCSNISSVALGIKSSQTSASAFNIFPNPFNSYIEIQACGDFIATDISILNLLGEKVASESITHQGAIKISTENLSPGIYFLKIITNKGEEIIYKIEK